MSSIGGVASFSFVPSLAGGGVGNLTPPTAITFLVFVVTAGGASLLVGFVFVGGGVGLFLEVLLLTVTETPEDLSALGEGGGVLNFSVVDSLDGAL